MVKRNVRLARMWLGAAVVAAGLGIGVNSANAQQCQFDCNGDTLALRAPGELRVRVDRGAVSGNVVTWAPLADSVGTCAAIRLIKSPFVVPPFNPELSGAYIDLVDRQLKFAAESSGTVGDPTQNSVVFTWNNLDTQPGPLSGGVAGSLNVSNAGGLFQVAPGSGAARQINDGVRPHLFPSTNVRWLATWTSPDARPSRVWAALTGNSGTMLVRADIGPGGDFSWTTVLDPKDPASPAVAALAPVAIAVSPGSPDFVRLGTTDNGVWAKDGGAEWFKLSIEPGLSPGAKEQVSFLGYVGTSLFACLNGLGLYRSSDDGYTWSKLSLMTSRPNPQTGAFCPDDSTLRAPVVRSMAADPGNPSQIYAGLVTWGVYRSPDGGTTWTRGNDGLVLCPSLTYPNGRPVDVLSIVVDRSAPNTVLAGTSGRGMFRSTDFGATWVELGGVSNTISVTSIVEDPGDAAIFTASTEAEGLIRSVDSAVSWGSYGTGITTNDLTLIVADPTAQGGLLVGSEGAGVYRPGTSVPLSRTIKTGGTDPDKLDLQLGLGIKFNDGPVTQGDSLFVVRAQTYQGYAVWRGRTPEPTSMRLIGLYDRSNPEFCLADPCDVQFPRRIQGCFADKRAACFTFAGTDSVSFFDRDVYNGFTYYYAVSAFDYGYTGNVFPSALDREMLFSPRGPNETAAESAPFLGCGVGGSVNTNQLMFQVNGDAAPDLTNVFAVPNPLRRQGGWDLGDAATVRFVNVTPGSKCEIFTVAGDLVTELTNVASDGVQRGNIEWNTRNAFGEDVASGVYIYRITDARGGEFVGRVTIIR